MTAPEQAPAGDPPVAPPSPTGHDRTLPARIAAVVAVSLAVHAGVASLLGHVTVFPAIEELPALVVTSIAPPPYRPEPRAQRDLLDAIASHRDETDMPALDQFTPRLEPPGVALPPPFSPQHTLLSGLLGGTTARLDWSRITDILKDLDHPQAGRRGAFEGTLHRFKRIDRVRSKGRWFDGRGKETAEDRLYTYRCQFPGRRRGPDGRTDDAWVALDYRVSLRWPESLGGRYRFRLTSDDGAVFRIDGKDVIDHDGHHKFRPKEGEIDLTPGSHSFHLAFILGPKSELGVILHVLRVGASSWEVFDLRPILLEGLLQQQDPLADEALTLEGEFE